MLRKAKETLRFFVDKEHSFKMLDIPPSTKLVEFQRMYIIGLFEYSL